MRAFLRVSGALFTFISIAWLLRLTFAVPVQVDGVAVPVWVSVIPMIIAGSLATWAFRLARRVPRA